jgi:hypothetical protein
VTVPTAQLAGPEGGGQIDRGVLNQSGYISCGGVAEAQNEPPGEWQFGYRIGMLLAAAGPAVPAVD